MTGSSPFQLLTEISQTGYRVNLSLERPDGNIVLTFPNERGVVAKRLIRPAQLHNLEQLQRVIESIRSGIAIGNGTSTPQLLQAVTQGKACWPIAI